MVYSIIKVTLLMTGSFYLLQPAIAAKMQIVNENKKALSLKIQAEGDTMIESLGTFIKKIPAEHYFTFSIEASDLNGKSHFSIKGDTNPFTPGDKCDHLSVDKNYKVTFLNDTAGTTCLAEEIKDD